MSNDYDFWMVVLTALSVVGMFVIAIIAIWQDRLRPRPKLSLKLKSKSGVVVRVSQGDTQRYFHLLVENTRRWSTAKSVRVVLRRVFTQDAGGRYYERSRHNFQLTWSPAYAHDVTPNITNVDDLDIGFVSKKTNKFQVLLYGVGTIPEATLASGESMVIALDIVADNYFSDKLRFFKIDWNGQWEDDDVKIERCLVIQEVGDRFLDQS